MKKLQIVTEVSRSYGVSARMLRHYEKLGLIGSERKEDYGQHTIEIVASVSESRDTPVWCMVYDDLGYQDEAHIFAEQQKNVKALVPYSVCCLLNKAVFREFSYKIRPSAFG